MICNIIQKMALKIGVDGNEANVENRVGVNQYAAELLTALEQLPEAKNHEWVIYLRNAPLGHLPRERVGWRYVILPQEGGMWVIKKLMPRLWSNPEQIDIFFTPNHYAPPLLRVPLVLSIMDLGYLQFSDQFKRYDLQQLKIWGSWSIRIAKKVLAISKSTKKEIVTAYPHAKSKVVVTPLGYDKASYYFPYSSQKIAQVKKRYAISGEYMLYVGTLKPSKNIEGLIDAFSQLNAPLHLVIAGKKGWLYETIFERVKEKQIQEKVIFTDFVPEKDKAALMAGAKVFVSPSFWEGFGIPALESLAVGTPVVVSNVASYPEVVGEAGILVDPANTTSIAEGIRKVVSASAVTYNKKVAQGLSQAAKFSWEKTARQTLTALENT